MALGKTVQVVIRSPESRNIIHETVVMAFQRTSAFVYF